jgi:hypothetical protein
MDHGPAGKVLTVLNIDEIDLGAWRRGCRPTSWLILCDGGTTRCYTEYEQTNKGIEITPSDVSQFTQVHF